MIVVACPKSGTTSLAKMFGFAHELRFTPDKPVPEMEELKSGIYHPHSEVSWMAAPYVPEMLPAGVPLLHVVRHPLRVIASLCALGFWTTEHKAYREFATSKVPKCAELTPIAASAALWLEWNLFCKGAPRLRIEDIADAPRLNPGALFEVAWEDIADEQLKIKVLEMAVEYGYMEKIEP